MNPCEHTYVAVDQQWEKCEKCGDIMPLSAASFAKKHFPSIDDEPWYPAIVAIAEGYANRITPEDKYENLLADWKIQKSIIAEQAGEIEILMHQLIQERQNGKRI